MMVVTNGDRILCERCFEAQLNPHDEATFAYSTVEYATCESCGKSTSEEGI